MKRILVLLLILFVLLVFWAIVRFVIGGSEDSWICVDGQWIKHGYPSSPKPASGCGEGVIIGK